VAERNNRIFVVEDDVELADMLCAFFSAQGYEIEATTWGEEALRLIPKRLPGVVLLDIRLPDIDGYQVCRRLREARRTEHLPVIFLTDKREKKDRLAGLELGAVDYITKPFDIHELHLRVRNALRRASRTSLANPITGLPEQALLREHLEAILPQEGWGIVFISLGGLDGFRDSYGFVAADDVVRALSLMIANTMHEDETTDAFVGHAAPEEFVVVTDDTHCDRLAEHCRHRLRASMPYFYPVADRERIRSQASVLGLGVEVACLTAADGPFTTVKEVGEALHERLEW
jgi:PleD family two-component response regulator